MNSRCSSSFQLNNRPIYKRVQIPITVHNFHSLPLEQSRLRVRALYDNLAPFERGRANVLKEAGWSNRKITGSLERQQNVRSEGLRDRLLQPLIVIISDLVCNRDIGNLKDY